MIDDKTKLVFGESIGNPLGNILDIAKISELAHSKGMPTVIDNTVATPILCKPFDYGVDIVVHSLTKYASGSGTGMGGIIIDGGRFDWASQKEHFLLLNTTMSAIMAVAKF